MVSKENGMKDTDKVAQRLALLEGINLSKADLESIATEIEDLERVVAELEEFGQVTPWISLQVQPPGKKA
jgi:Asp-tRNA(Asn)/Glu-tRNA(Gln) amidotransferase C subunit